MAESSGPAPDSTTAVEPESREAMDTSSDSSSSAVQHKETQFYKQLISRLPILPLPPKLPVDDATRSIQCSSCDFKASSHQRLGRHLLLKHFVIVRDDYAHYCPARRCLFHGQSAEEIKVHLGQVHQGRIQIKTVYHEEVAPDTPEPAELHNCTVLGCAFSGSNEEELEEHVKSSHQSRKSSVSKPSSKLYIRGKFHCEEDGCMYSSDVWKNLKVHFSKKHKREKSESSETSKPSVTQPPREDKEGFDPSDSGVTRAPRQKAPKRKYEDEEWDVTRPKRSRSERPKSPAEEHKSPAEGPKSQSEDPKSAEPKIKKVRVKLKPMLINFDPIQKALIAMSKVHDNLNQEVSKIDGVMEKLITEHSSTCQSCKRSPEFQEQRKFLSKHGVSDTEKMITRIQYLERELEKTQSSLNKLAAVKTDEMTYSKLLDGVPRPSLRKGYKLQTNNNNLKNHKL